MTPYEILEKANLILSKFYPLLKVNKRREILRLIYDIAKIKNDFSFSFLPKDAKNYEQLKKSLIKLRYPSSFSYTPLKNYYLPTPELDKKEEADLSGMDMLPKRIFYEIGAEKYNLFKRLKEKCHNSDFIPIESLKDYSKSLCIDSYSMRRNTWVLARQKSSFIKRCPCTKGCISCGYFVLNLGFGCPFECSYCYLQGYQNLNAIILPYNIEDFFSDFESRFSNLKFPIRLGTGEFTDSLALDPYTGYADELIKFFSRRNNVILELKTKSSNIDAILANKPAENIVVSFSLSPKEISEKEEFLCACVQERIEAMKKLYRAGWPVAFHLDPIILNDNFVALYKNLFDEVFSDISPEKIRWVSLGTFRFNPKTAVVVEKRFPFSKILEAEMSIDFDEKLRYPFLVRKKIYSQIISLLKKKGLDISRLYLCMEEARMWKELPLRPDFHW